MNTIRLKIRDLEIEGIGFDSFEKFEPVLSRAVEIWKEIGAIESAPKKNPPHSNEHKSTSLDGISINSFAAKLSGDTCRDLLRISAAYIVLVGGQQKFKREELINTAKESSRWKKNYADQMSVNITRMIAKSELTENATGIYSLPPQVIDEFKQKLS